MSDNVMSLALELLENGNEVSLTVKGNSMYPFLISARDKVVLKKTDPPFCRGDIVLYKCRNGKYALHRIVGIDAGGKLKIIGDGQLVADYPVCADDVIAKVISVERKGINLCERNIRWKLFSCKLFLALSRKFLVKRALRKGSVKSD